MGFKVKALGLSHHLCHTLLVFKVAVMDLMLLFRGSCGHLVVMCIGCSGGVYGFGVLMRWRRSHYGRWKTRPVSQSGLGRWLEVP